jgi:hypothetical protein
MVLLIAWDQQMNERSVATHIQTIKCADIDVEIQINVSNHFKHAIVVKIVRKMMMKRLHVFGLIKVKNRSVIHFIFDVVMVEY